MTARSDTKMPQQPLIQRLRIKIRFAYIRLILAPLSTVLARLRLRIWGAQFGPGLRVTGWVRLFVAGRLTIGSHVCMNSGPVNFVGGDRRMALWVGQDAELHIGDGCGLANSTICCLHRITLLPQTHIGGGCEIYDTDFHQLSSADRIANRGLVGGGPIRIGPRAFVGGWCLILKNVTIGEGAVIAAGSIVTHNVPDYELWGGVPAKFIRKIDRPGETSVAPAPPGQER